ncbi:MAG: hypothetical protein JNJ40_18305 [Bacteroidia bacterium]|nr:hypothetical protein [Bacteroidia bacterium]
MKTVKSLIVASIVIALSSCATEFKIIGDDVPVAVSSAFKTKYPSVSNPEWEVEKEDGRLIYEAEFKLDGKRKEAEFKPDGTFIKEE